MLPEGGGVDASVFDLLEGDTFGVDVVSGEEGLDAVELGVGGNEAGHPVVAVDDVGFDTGDDVVDDFPLEGEGEEVVFGGTVNARAVVEDAVLGEVNVLIGEGFLILGESVFKAVVLIFLEHAPVVGEGNVDVGVLFMKGSDERRGDIGHASCLGGHALGEVAHAFGKVGDLWGDDKDAGCFF